MIVIQQHPIVTLTTKTDSAIDYENPWLYQGTAFTSEHIDDFFGFVYWITNLQNGKAYIGRKYFYQKRKPKGGKRKVTTESNWKKYYGRDTFKREIISLHKTLGQVNYEETRQLFLNNVLTEADSDGTPKYYNSNILGRYMRKNYFGASD